MKAGSMSTVLFGMHCITVFHIDSRVCALVFACYNNDNYNNCVGGNGDEESKAMLPD